MCGRVRKGESVWVCMADLQNFPNQPFFFKQRNASLVDNDDEER